jgi:hypothetical protein
MFGTFWRFFRTFKGYLVLRPCNEHNPESWKILPQPYR